MRVVSPPDQTGRLAEALGAQPGVRDLVVLPGAARRPAGDSVSFDVRQGAANPVFRLLREFRLARRGAVTVEQTTEVLTAPRAPAGEVRTNSRFQSCTRCKEANPDDVNARTKFIAALALA